MLMKFLFLQNVRRVAVLFLTLPYLVICCVFDLSRLSFPRATFYILTQNLEIYSFDQLIL